MDESDETVQTLRFSKTIYSSKTEFKSLFYRPINYLKFPSKQNLLEEVDSLLYMDTDTIFLTSPERIWPHFNQMNDSHLAAVSLQNEEDTPGWYHDFSSRIPFYGNSGKQFIQLHFALRYN